MSGRPFAARTRLVFGPGALARLGELARGLGLRRVLLVSDPGLLASGHPQRAASLLRAAGLDDVRFVVVASDVVYPTGAMKDYESRFWLPFKGVTKPVYAIPGNHDWYDGLSAFLRLFTQQRWIGGWQTRQERSYFVLELPGKYWVWGIDIQLQVSL